MVDDARDAEPKVQGKDPVFLTSHRSSGYSPLSIPHVMRRRVGVTRYRLVCSLSFRDVLLQTILWMLLVVVTVGLAAPFFAY